MATAPAVRLAIVDGVATVRLDAPGTRNQLSSALLRTLAQRLDEAVAHPGLRVVVLTHTGPVFCAGADLQEQQRTGGQGISGLAAVLRTLWDAPVPVVARVGGAVRGGGMGLVAAADLAVAADTATFAFSEVRLGVVPALVSVVCLRKLKLAAATEAFLTGEPMDARWAQAAGLVHRLAAPGELDAAVERLVAELRRGGPSALAAAKRLLRTEPQGTVAEGLARMAELSRASFASEEATEGIAAFLGRRAPAWAVARG